MTHTSMYDSTVQDKCGPYRPRPQYPSSGVLDSEKLFSPRSGPFGVQNDPNCATEVDAVNGGVICALTGSNHEHAWVNNLEVKTPNRKFLPPSEEVLRVNNCQCTDSSSSSSLDIGHQTPNCHGTPSGSSSERRGTESPRSYSQLYPELSSPRSVDFSSYSLQKSYMWEANGSSTMAPPVDTAPVWNLESSHLYSVSNQTRNEQSFQNLACYTQHPTSYPYSLIDPNQSWPSPASSTSEATTPTDGHISSSWPGTGYLLPSPSYHPSFVPAPLPIPTRETQSPNGRRTTKKVLLACHFCRERKIACGRPSIGSANMTCNQCLRRGLECKYPTGSRRGQHKRTPRNIT